MGHTIDFIRQIPDTSAILTETQSAFVASLVKFRRAFYRGLNPVIRQEFVFTEPEQYNWAAWRLLTMVSELRDDAACPAQYFSIDPKFMERENGGLFEQIVLEYPSHIENLPHRIEIRDVAYPF